MTYIEEMHHRLDEESISYCQNFFLEIGATAGKLCQLDDKRTRRNQEV